jgi:hypothetical protein
MLRLAVTLLTVALAASAAGRARAIDNTDASRIILLLVVGDDKARDGIKSWINLFQNNVQSLLDDFSLGGSGSGGGINVDVVTKDVKEPAKRNELEASFAQQPSLQVLSTVGTYGGQSTLVDNEIYLGDFKGSLTVPYVHFAQTVVPGQFKITREALAVVTLYAYAMAIAKISPPDRSRFVVCQVLDRANMYRNSDLDPDARSRLENLFRAISTELEARACGGKK